MNTHDYQPGGVPPHEHPHVHDDVQHHLFCRRALSWTAIVAGALAAIGISFLFNLFSVGAGLSAFTVDKNGLYTLAIGGVIWLIICGIVSMFLAGLIAGRVAAKRGGECSGCLHGFIAWCLALILGFLLASNFTTMFVVPSTNANGLPPIMRMTTITTDRTVTVNKSDTTTQRTVDTDKQVAPKTVEKAANAIGGAAIAAFFIFLLGALAAMLGGHIGMRHCGKHCRKE